MRSARGLAVTLACGLAGCAVLSPKPPRPSMTIPAELAAVSARPGAGGNDSGAVAAPLLAPEVTLSAVPAGSVAAAVPAMTLGGVAFHSLQWQVKVDALPTGVTAPALQRQLQAALDAIDDALTTYRPDSELMRFNRQPLDVWWPVSPLLLQGVMIAAETSRLSGGAYDVTIGPLVELWGFGAAPAPETLPSAAAIAAAKARVGWERIGIDPERRALRRLADVRLDLSSLGEGAGVDALARVLEQAGVRNYLVRVAGTSRQLGQRPGGGPWGLAIERPDGSGQPGRGLRTAASVVSTSGAYRNRREIGGQRYAHTLDSVTGYPVTHAGVSVTVVLPASEGAMRVDALATAFNVLGPERGLALARERGLAVFYLERTETGLRERWSPAFVPFLVD